MSLVDAYAVLGHAPLHQETLFDEVLLVPVRASERSLRSVESYFSGHHCAGRGEMQTAHPFLFPLYHEGSLRLLGAVDASENAEDVQTQAIRQARRQGAWLERGFIADELVFLPWWQPKDSMMAEEMRVSTASSPNFSTFTDQDFPAVEVEMDDSKLSADLRRMEVSVLDLEEYEHSLHAPPFDSICLSLRPDSASLLSSGELVQDAERLLLNSGLDALASALPSLLAGTIVHDGSREVSFRAVTRAIQEHSPGFVPAALRNVTFDARPRLNRLFLAPGLYPTGWTHGGPRPKTREQAWAMAVQLYEHYGLDLPEDVTP